MKVRDSFPVLYYFTAADVYLEYNIPMSGYYLYQSPRLESFPERFPDIFLQKDPLSDPVYTVVQNSGLGEWLIRFLAEKQGAVMGPRILMPEQALRQFSGGYPTARNLLFPADVSGGPSAPRGLLFMDGMKLTVFKALEEILKGDDPVYAPLRSYMSSVEGENPAGEGLWQLSDALAGIFYHYGMNCLPLVEAWDRGESFFDSNAGSGDIAAEAWQRGLWRRIFKEGAPYTHLSRVLSEVMASGEGYNPGGFDKSLAGTHFPVPPSKPARILLFGSMFLGETGLRFFRYLAADFEVHHFILTPSKVFAVSPESPSPKQPFLRNNARLSAGFSTLLHGEINLDENWDNPGKKNTLLHKLRSSLIEDSPITAEEPIEDDGSLAFHNVSGPRRAVEVLKDRILEALRENPDLAPTQIGVLAPDISRFAPYIETVFPSKNSNTNREAVDHLDYNLTDLPVRSEAPYPSAYNALKELPGSRFGRTSLLKLLTNPCFSPFSRSSSADEAGKDWQRIVETLHIRWGVDEEHRRSEGAADPRTGAWETAFQRLLAAYYHDEDDRSDILPAELAGDGEADIAGELIHVIRSLDKELRFLDRKKLSLKDWTLEWERIVERWLTPRHESEDERDHLRMKGAIRDLLALDEGVNGLSDFPDQLLPWPAFSSLLDEFSSPSGGRRGRYLSRGITCSSLKPARAIPFRRIYILGLDEGAWPGREFLTGFDLRDRVPVFIDLSRESVDRFTLVETIFSATDHLSLFYTGRDSQRGDPLSPAAPMVELLEHLGDGAEILERHHPLNPFHPSALTGEGGLASSSSEAASLGELLYRGVVKSRFKVVPLPPPEDEETVDWKTLVKFLKNPIEYFYLHRLGTARSAVEDEGGEDDVLETGFLDWWQWQNTHVAENPAALLEPSKLVEEFRRHFILEGSVSDTPAGELQSESQEADAAALAEDLGGIIAKGFDIIGSNKETFSSRFVPGLAFPTREGEILNLPAPRVSLMSDEGEEHIHITGMLQGLRLFKSPGDEREKEVWTLLEFVSAKETQSRHNLRSWISALMVGASMGDDAPKEIRVFRLNPNSKNKALRRYFFQSAYCPAEKGPDEIVLLKNPSAILHSLLKTFRGGESSPLPLYPALADKLGIMDKKGFLEDGQLSAAAEDAWFEILGNSYNNSALKKCYYRQHYLKEPDFSSEAFEQAWETLYRKGGLL